jgi:2-polyprenyl-6-methoxyphenol hydroxylase-like FAD-dependent oxidoreductase
MHVAIVGAGPTGLFTGIGLARRGHSVTVVDRDAGPPADGGGWFRRGVMQFHHAHAFRPQVADALRHEAPEAYERWLEAGAEPVSMPGREDQVAMRSRRETFERALHAAAVDQLGLRVRRGHVDEVLVDHSRAVGLRVDGLPMDADLVLDASGRSGRVGAGLRGEPLAGASCGIAYVDRQYQLLPGADPGPLLNPLAWQGDYDGYQVIVFVHERGIFSVLLVRPTADEDLRLLRDQAAFEAACRAIPALAEWTDPERSRPLTRVLPGGELKNYFRDQRGPEGRLALPGLVFVGDAVCTTTPNFGRGVTTSLLQARELLRLLDEHPTDKVAATEAFDAWCLTNMLPWVEDHVRMDEAARQRWTGADVDLSQRLPSDLVMAAAEVDRGIGAALGPYLDMSGGPAALDAVEPRARAVYESGWRPTSPPGPDRDELAAIVKEAADEFVWIPVQRGKRPSDASRRSPAVASGGTSTG